MGEGMFGRLFGKKSTDADMGVVSSEDRYERVESSSDPHSVQLKDGIPLYHALLENPDAPALTKDESDMARERLDEIIQNNPDAVLSCRGLSLEEARQRLLDAERTVQRAA